MKRQEGKGKKGFKIRKRRAESQPTHRQTPKTGQKDRQTDRQTDRQRSRQGVAAKDGEMWGRAVTLCC